MTDRNINKPILTVAAALLLVVLAAVLVCALPSNDVASAAGIPDAVSDDIVSFYEENIAKEPFISSMGNTRRAKLENAFSLTHNRLNCCLILEDLGARTNKPQSLNELSKMSDKQIYSTGKVLIESYTATLTDQEKQELKAKFFTALKK